MEKEEETRDDGGELYFVEMVALSFQYLITMLAYVKSVAQVRSNG